MVVNEAMLFGLPVIGSRFAGACEELLSTPGTGVLIDPRDEPGFARAIEHALEAWTDIDPSISRSLILKQDFRETSQAMQEAVRRCVA